MYYWGLGVEKGPGSRSSPFFRKAAHMGYAYAHVSLGVAFEQGGGVEQSFKEAAAQYRLAIEAERLPKALAYLAWLYQEGDGVEQDTAKARKLYEEAVAAGGSLRTDRVWICACQRNRRLRAGRQSRSQDAAAGSRRGPYPRLGGIGRHVR
ncbi:hypothetical protein QW131_14635 [Roseibium salinum]|nr:hypothetical protein [Roseibium salinum]